VHGGLARQTDPHAQVRPRGPEFDTVLDEAEANRARLSAGNTYYGGCGTPRADRTGSQQVRQMGEVEGGKKGSHGAFLGSKLLMHPQQS
jgi:hypothetical protein